MSESVAVKTIAPGASGVDPESPAAVAAKEILRKRRAGMIPPLPPKPLKLAETKTARKGPGQGAKRCGRCGADWESRPAGKGKGRYLRICTGCDREVASCDCPPDPYRTAKNQKHLADRASNQRAKRAATAPDDATPPAAVSAGLKVFTPPTRLQEILGEAILVLEAERNKIDATLEQLKQLAK